jgi:diguanylate cyclase (GGDEF)-like protein
MGLEEADKRGQVSCEVPVEKNVESLIRLLFSQKLSHLKVLVLAMGTTMAIFALDLVTPQELSFSLFYLFPIAVGMLFGSRKTGYANALLATLAWMAAQLISGQPFSSIFYLLWAFVIRIATNAIFAYLLDALKQVIEGLRELSLIDPLTGAANRRFFEGYLDRTIDRSVRDHQPLTLLALDFDDFKALNDRQGHDRGDLALMGLVRAIQGRIRPDDMLCRLGGDEFALVLYAMDYQKSEEVIARLMDAVRAEFEARGLDATLSVGAITYTEMDSGARNMLKRADELLYDVKRAGKNAIKHLAEPSRAG